MTSGGYAGVAAVGPEGEVVYTLPGGGRHLLEVPPYTAAPLDIGPAEARLKWIGSELYALLGRWAFRVNYRPSKDVSPESDTRSGLDFATIGLVPNPAKEWLTRRARRKREAPSRNTGLLE